MLPSRTSGSCRSRPTDLHREAGRRAEHPGESRDARAAPLTRSDLGDERDVRASVSQAASAMDSAPSSIAPATIPSAVLQACSYSSRPGRAGDLRHRGDQHLTHDGIVLRPRTVGDMPGAELAQLRHDRVEVAQRLAEQDERAEQHRLLTLRIDAGKQRLHSRRCGEEPRVEDVHQLVAARSDEVEARLEGFQVHLHSCLAGVIWTRRRAGRRWAERARRRRRSASSWSSRSSWSCRVSN